MLDKEVTHRREWAGPLVHYTLQEVAEEMAEEVVEEGGSWRETQQGGNMQAH